jgi:hypothetical protein
LKFAEKLNSKLPDEKRSLSTSEESVVALTTLVVLSRRS